MGLGGGEVTGVPAPPSNHADESDLSAWHQIWPVGMGEGLPPSSKLHMVPQWVPIIYTLAHAAGGRLLTTSCLSSTETGRGLWPPSTSQGGDGYRGYQLQLRVPPKHCPAQPFAPEVKVPKLASEAYGSLAAQGALLGARMVPLWFPFPNTAEQWQECPTAKAKLHSLDLWRLSRGPD